MTVWFCQRDNRTGAIKRRNLFGEPSFTICAQGTGDSFASDYWLEDDGKMAPTTLDDKPAYRVPPMAEIAEIPPCGFSVASFFAGAGGSSLGYRMAGFRVRYANEFVPIAQESYRANMAEGTVLGQGELDVLDGSPPCQAFSTAGRREKGWGKDRAYEHGAAQRNEDLFFEFVRLRDGIMPRTFVAENVSGLVKGVAKGYFLEILRELKRGYRVEARLLDAQWLGVPQARQRLVFVGVREDLVLDPAFPEPLPHRYSVREALPWIGRAVSGRLGTGYKRPPVELAKPSPTIMASGAEQQRFEITDHSKVEARKIGTRDSVPENVAASLEGYAIEKEWDRLNPGQASDKFFSLVRPDADQPCPTITSAGVGLADGTGAPGGVASVTHPFEKRKFTILEVKRLCSFPDDFVLAGTYGQQWERLGNSVPPVMMRHVAEALRDRVLIPARDAIRIAAEGQSGRPRS
jgi:DNA (cytosine-5)-methyltransferase 1